MIMKSPGALPGRKDVYTTAEAAKLCRVHKNTVIAAINRGLLRSMKTPGGHNRVARHDLLEYMRRSGIAVPEWADPPPARVLVVGEGEATVNAVAELLPYPRFQVRHCDGLYAAGLQSAAEPPAVVLCDVALGAPGFGPEGGGPALIGLHDGDAGSHETGMFGALLERGGLNKLEAMIASLV